MGVNVANDIAGWWDTGHCPGRSRWVPTAQRQDDHPLVVPQLLIRLHKQTLHHLSTEKNVLTCLHCNKSL
jgi:hypothetical protein